MVILRLGVCVNEGIYENDIIRRDACLDGFAIRLPKLITSAMFREGLSHHPPLLN